jgi:conjugative transfer signal peptidase TraF
MKPKAGLLFWVAGGVLLMAASCLELQPKLVWNRTESVPEGLYFVASKAPLERGLLVAFRPSREDQEWLERRGYIGTRWPLLKQISGLEGDTVCRVNLSISINGIVVAKALEHDSFGRELPSWEGCYTLQSGELLLLAPHPRSLDGRYFGVQKADGVLGTACPLWTWKSSTPENSPQELPVDDRAEKSPVSRRARLRPCPTRTAKSLSAHPFPGDREPDEGCTDLGGRGGAE